MGFSSQNAGVGSLSFSRGSSRPRNRAGVSCTAGGCLPAEPAGKPRITGVGSLSLLQGIFPTQESSPGLLHCRRVLHQLSHRGALAGPPHWSPRCCTVSLSQPQRRGFLTVPSTAQRVSHCSTSLSATAQRVSHCSMSLPTLVLFFSFQIFPSVLSLLLPSFSDSSHPDRSGMASHCGVALHFVMIRDAEHLFVGLLAICVCLDMILSVCIYYLCVYILFG